MTSAIVDYLLATRSGRRFAATPSDRLVDMLGNVEARDHEFDNPVARKTAWTPLKKGGSYFRTHVLVAASRQQLEFRASRELMLFAGASLLIGLTVLWLGLDQSG